MTTSDTSNLTDRIKAAIKNQTLEIPRNTYAKITIGYFDFVLPYDDALKLAKVMQTAQKIEYGYSNGPTKFSPLNDQEFKWAAMSDYDYKIHKLSSVLKVTVDELKKSEFLQEDINQ